jgi:hypothetical protein
LEKYLDIESGDHWGLLKVFYEWKKGKNVPFVNLRALK